MLNRQNWYWLLFTLFFICIGSWLIYCLKLNVKQKNQTEFSQYWHFYGVEYAKFTAQGELVEHFWADDLSKQGEKYFFTKPCLEILDQEEVVWSITALNGEKEGQKIILESEVKIWPKKNFRGFTGHLKGEQLVYWSQDKRYAIHPLNLTFKDDQGYLWFISAKNADSDNLIELFLREHVVITCPEKDLVIDTSSLKLKLKQQLATTDSLLLIWEKANQISAVGGNFWLKKGLLKLMSEIKIIYNFDHE